MHSVKTRRWMSYQGVSLGINLQGLYSIIIVCIHILILHAHPDVLGSDLSWGKRGVGCFASALWKQRKGCPGASWGEGDIMVGHPRTSPGNVSFLLWHPSRLFHAVRKRSVQMWKEPFGWKDNRHASSWSVSAGIRCFSTEKHQTGFSTPKFMTHCIYEQPSVKDTHFTSPQDSSSSPATTFLQRHNPRIRHNLYFFMCPKGFVSVTVMARGHDLLTFPADSQARKTSQLTRAPWFLLVFRGLTENPAMAPVTVLLSMK